MATFESDNNTFRNHGHTLTRPYRIYGELPWNFIIHVQLLVIKQLGHVKNSTWDILETTRNCLHTRNFSLAKKNGGVLIGQNNISMRATVVYEATPGEIKRVWADSI